VPSISQLHTWTTVDYQNHPGQGKGICFNGNGSSIFIAISRATLLQLAKATGAVITSNHTTIQCTEALWDAINSQFWTTPAGGGGVFTVARWNGAAAVINLPHTGQSSWGQIVVNGHYWTGNYFDGTMTELDAATGAVIIAALNVPGANPTDPTGTIAFDAVNQNLWLTNIPNKLTRISEPFGAVTGTFFPAGVGSWGGFCIANGFLWGTDNTNNTLVKMDLNANVVQTIALPVTAPRYICFDGLWFWIWDDTGTVSAYNSIGSFQAQISITVADANQEIANDPVEGPGLVWATYGNNPYFVTQLQLIGGVLPGGGIVQGTHAGFWNAGHFGGGTK